MHSTRASPRIPLFSDFLSGCLAVRDTQILSISNNKFLSNKVNLINYYEGSASVFLQRCSLVLFSSNSLFENSASGIEAAGGLRIENSSHAIISQNNLSRNSGYLGGAIAIYQVTMLNVTSNSMSNNNARASGGALQAIHVPHSFFWNNSFHSNQANVGGGGACVSFATNCSFVNNTFRGNEAFTCGGALRTRNITNLTIQKCVFNDNFFNSSRAFAVSGGAIFTFRADYLFISESAFRNNSACMQNCEQGDFGSGGGVFLHQLVSVEITKSNFSQNSANRANSLHLYLVKRASISHNYFLHNQNGKFDLEFSSWENSSAKFWDNLFQNGQTSVHLADTANSNFEFTSCKFSNNRVTSNLPLASSISARLSQSSLKIINSTFSNCTSLSSPHFQTEIPGNSGTGFGVISVIPSTPSFIPIVSIEGSTFENEKQDNKGLLYFFNSNVSLRDCSTLGEYFSYSPLLSLFQTNLTLHNCWLKGESLLYCANSTKVSLSGRGEETKLDWSSCALCKIKQNCAKYFLPSNLIVAFLLFAFLIGFLIALLVCRKKHLNNL